MRDTILKFRMLIWFISEAIGNWKETVWKTDLDAPYCCSGREYESPCGCGGVTTREVYTDMMIKNDRNAQPINFGDSHHGE